MKVHALLVAASLWLVGCGGSRLPPEIPAGSPARAPRNVSGKPADVQPDPSSPFARDARAEVLIGRLGRPAAKILALYDEARRQRDVVKSQCLRSKLDAIADLERRGRTLAGDVRDAAFDAGSRADAAFSELGALEARAHALMSEARQCVGEEVGYASGTTEVSGRSLKIRDLEQRTSALKEVTHRSVARDVLASKTVLAGLAIGARGPALRSALPLQPAPAGAPPPPPPGRPAVPPPSQGGAHDASMLLRSAQVMLAVFEVDKKLDSVDQIARDLGGYLSLRGDREISVRVPRERFDEALRRIEKLGDVLHRSIAAEDVTDQYVDLELRLKNAQAVRERLEKLLQNATVKDAVEIQKELAKVTEEIERLNGKLKLLRDRIAFSTITVTFERTEPQRVRSKALLPFPWMRTMGLAPLLQVPR
jgi:hypothetical protein